jgi:hypothetical protein
MDRFLPASPASIVDHPRTAMRARNVTTAPNAGPSRGDAALIRLERAPPGGAGLAPLRRTTALAPVPVT